jgi:predicted transcriptional regulator
MCPPTRAARRSVRALQGFVRGDGRRRTESKLRKDHREGGRILPLTTPIDGRFFGRHTSPMVVGAAPLGELERAVMEYVWSHGAADVKDVHRAIGTRRRITSNTVQSTLERLFRKGLMDREKVSHAYVYRAALTREAYGAAVVSSVVADVLGPDREAMLSAFVDVTERTGGDALARLEEMIAARRRAERQR